MHVTYNTIRGAQLSACKNQINALVPTWKSYKPFHLLHMMYDNVRQKCTLCKGEDIVEAFTSMSLSTHKWG